MLRTLAATTTLALLSLSSSLSYAAPTSPTAHVVGERASFVVDTTADRTVGLVSGGTFATTISQAALNGGDYKINFDYSVDIAILGNQQGKQNLALPASFFAPDFMSNLRAKKRFVSSQFKVEYLGTEDVTTLDGQTYEGADKIRIYDLKLDLNSPFYGLASAMFATTDSIGFTAPAPVPADAQLIADVAAGVPVLGAVRIDLSGSQFGVTVKIGADYQAR